MNRRGFLKTVAAVALAPRLEIPVAAAPARGEWVHVPHDYVLRTLDCSMFDFTVEFTNELWNLPVWELPDAHGRAELPGWAFPEVAITAACC